MKIHIKEVRSLQNYTDGLRECEESIYMQKQCDKSNFSLMMMSDKADFDKIYVQIPTERRL